MSYYLAYPPTLHLVIESKYSITAGFAVLVVLVGLYTQLLPPLGVLILLPLIGQFFTGYGIRSFSLSEQQSPSRLIPYMAINVFVATSSPIVMGLTLVTGT